MNQMNWDEKYIFEEVVLCSFLLFYILHVFYHVEETLLFSRWNGGSLHFILLERKNKVPGRINLDVILDIRNFVLKIFEIFLKWSTAEAHTLWFWAFLGSGLFRCHNFEGNPKTSVYEFYLYVSAVHKKINDIRQTVQRERSFQWVHFLRNTMLYYSCLTP